MNDLVSTESSATIVNDFVARRKAQIYVEKFQSGGLEAAEEWTKENINWQDRVVFQKYVISELQKQGYTLIIPGDIE